MTRKYTLEELHKKGVISYKPLLYREIKDKVDQLILSGSSKAEAVRKVSSYMGWTVQGIYQALRKAP